MKPEDLIVGKVYRSKCPIQKNDREERHIDSMTLYVYREYEKEEEYDCSYKFDAYACGYYIEWVHFTPHGLEGLEPADDYLELK